MYHGAQTLLYCSGVIVMTTCLQSSVYWVSSLAIALSLQTVLALGSSGKAVDAPVGSDRRLAQTTSEAPPLYPPDAPPPRRTPLPDRRQEIEEQTVGADYRVSALQPDSKGALWVGSWQGLAKINPATGQILQRVSLPNATVGAIAQDRSGRIWVGTYEGIVRLDPRTGAITAQNFALPSNRVLSLLVDQRGYLWVGTDAGLAMISPDQGLLKTTLKTLPGVSANALALDALGNLWVGTLEGLVQINTANALIMRQVKNLPGVTVQTLAASPWGTLWIGTPNALLEADLGIQRVVQTIAEPAKPATKTSAAKATATKTTATKTMGRSQTTPLKSAQKPVSSTKTTTKPPQLRQQVVFLAPELPTFKLRTVNQLKGRNITTLGFDNMPTLWVGTTTGLLRINPFNGVAGGEIPYLPSSRILSLAPDAGGKLWVGTSEGLAWVNLTTFRGNPHQTFLPAGK